MTKLLRPFLRLLVISCALALTALAEPPAAPGAFSFLRTAELPNNLSGLQTRSTEFRPASGTGPSVWLVGASHLGTAAYYQALQQRLNAQTVVLYEGVGLHDVTQAPGPGTGGAGLQPALAKALGLLFQLDAIDYRGANFVNSDLKVPDIEAQVEQRGATQGTTQGPAGDNAVLDQLMDALQGTGVTGGMLTQLAGLLGSSPQMRETSKLLLIESLNRAGEFMEMAKTVSPQMKDVLDVILTQRNEIVLRDLRAQLAKLRPGQSVAIFYGAAHMDEIVRRLQSDLHYVPVQEQWDTAFTADTAQSGVAPAQVRLLLEMLKLQLQQVKPPAP